MKQRSLTQSEIEEGKKLRRDGYSKRRLAKFFQVGPTTIWENIFSDKKRTRIYRKRVFIPRIGSRCRNCEVYLTREIKYPNHIPTNYQMLDLCIGCYLDEKGLKYKDLI